MDMLVDGVGTRTQHGKPLQCCSNLVEPVEPAVAAVAAVAEEEEEWKDDCKIMIPQLLACVSKGTASH